MASDDRLESNEAVNHVPSESEGEVRDAVWPFPSNSTGKVVAR